MRVNKDGPIPSHRPDLGPCWIWTGYTRNGRGSLWDGGRNEYAYRISWRLHFGEIPADQEVCHRCDNGLCLRPDHLFLGTRQDNVTDMWRKRRASPPPRITGMQHWQSGHTDDVVGEVRQLWASRDYQQRDLARKYGVSQSTIWRWVHGNVRRSA